MPASKAPARRRSSAACRRRGSIPACAGRTPAIVSASSRWPLPATPATATISPARTSARHPSRPRRRGRPAPRGPRPRAPRAPASRPFAGRCAVSTSWPIMSDASDCAVAPAVGTVAIALPGSQHGDPVGDRHHLVQLVRDEDDRPALGGDLPQRQEQRVRLFGREHGGRLVEDEDACVLVEGVEDLDALLLADRRAATRARADRPAGGSARRAARTWLSTARGSMRKRRPAPRLSPSTRFSATVNRSTSRKCWWTMHTPASIASRGDVKATRLAEEHDLALVGVVQAGEDVRERRLAGAVLAEQRVHLAGSGLEVDAVVGERRRESVS